MKNITTLRTSETTNLTLTGAVGVLGGIWLIVSPFLFGYNDSNSANSSTGATTMGLVCGVITIGLAGFCMATEKLPTMQLYRFGAAIALILMGVWLVLAPYLFDYFSLRNPLYNLQITGVIFILIAGYVFQELYSQYQERESREPTAF